MENITVNVIECNASLFACSYANYIQTTEQTAFGDVLFRMRAPVSVISEIKNLREDGIVII